MVSKKNASAAEILLELLGDSDELEIRGVRLEADEEPIVLEFDQAALAGGGGIPPGLIVQAINQTVQRMMAQAPAIALQTMADFGLVSPEAAAAYGGVTAQPPMTAPGIPSALIPESFSEAKPKWSNRISDVKFGATAADGGSRDSVLMLGGQNALPFQDPNMIRPLVTFDVFDMKIALPKPIREAFGDDVMQDPGAWAQKSVKDFGADAVTIHVISTDPYIKDTSAKEAAKTVEEVLQAVKVPLVIGGSGNADKDPEVLAACAEAASGERCILASANLNYGDKGNKMVIDAALKHNHNVLAFTAMDINNQKQLNRKLLDGGIPSDRILMDPTTASLGYGTEYSFSIYERLRMAGLAGDKLLAFPMSSGTTNAWGAREAHRSEKKEPMLGPREFRGPLWEATTAFNLSLVGADIFMMLHPLSVKIFREMVDALIPSASGHPYEYSDWVTAPY
ncbi:MAG: CO dehydrogenase/acetyl-CoA synthase subunit delta [Candidatus Hodarchaeales archaeon]|jgi:acetyl-CoA decarbonylase/synthase complex subunit delta